MAIGKLTVQVEADTASAVAQVALAAQAMKQSLENIDASFSDWYDNEKSKKEANLAGGDANDQLWKGFEKKQGKNEKKSRSRFARLLTKWIAIVSAFGETVSVALYGAAGALTSLVSSFATAAGASLALLPIATGLASAFTVMAVGSMNVGAGLSAVNK